MLAKISNSSPVQNARRTMKWTRVRASFRAHQLLGNRQAAKSFEQDAPELSPVQRQVVDDLRHDGIALVSFDDLVGDAALWEDLKRDMLAFAGGAEADAGTTEGKPKDKDDFLIRRLRREAKDRKKQGLVPHEPGLAPDSPWVRYGTSPQILDTVNAYRGLWTKFIDHDHWYTVPFGADHGRVGSQNWHRDPEDQHVVKVFTYFNDVDEESGPFQYVPGSPEGGRYGDLWPWKVVGETYPSQEELAARIPESEYRTATGPAGTIIFCDTSGFHRGGFARSRPRILSYFTYVSAASLLSGRQRRYFRIDPPANGHARPAASYALD